MQSGTIIYWPNFQFSDGGSADKYFVLLNAPVSFNDLLIFCKTTSRKKDKIEREGCIPELSLFMIKGGKEHFPVDTWLQFYELYEFSPKELLVAKFGKGVEREGVLSDLTMRQIRNCLKRCQDVSRRHLSLVLKEINQKVPLPKVPGLI